MDDNLQKYSEVFMDVFQVSKELLSESLRYQSIEAWDSVGHMELISRLEESFDLNLEMDDVIDFSSFEKGKQILHKYGIQL
jgi:acyl carrier protein